MQLARINFYNTIGYTYSEEYGFGIVYTAGDEGFFCFYEDGKVRPSDRNTFDPYSQLSSMIKKETEVSSSPVLTGKLKEASEQGALVTFHSALTATVRLEGKDFDVCLAPDYRQKGCTCGKRGCIHRDIVKYAFRVRIAALQEAYILSSEPVMKSYLTSGKLYRLLEDFNRVPGLWDKKEEQKTVYEKIREIIDELLRPDSDIYIAGAVCRLILERDAYYYDAGLLSGYRYLFAAFAGHERIRNALEVANIIEGNGVEDRQQKSNRMVLKRAVKEYDKAWNELYGKKKDSGPSDMKEFLLKYREDLTGLLSYYAYSKEELAETDVPYLVRIITQKVPDNGRIPAVIDKLDEKFTGYTEWQPVIFAKLLGALSREEVLTVCGRLKNLKLSPKEIRSLGPENGKNLLNCMKIDPASFAYALTELLSDAPDEEKGHFILGKLPEMEWKDREAYWKILRETVTGMKHCRFLLLLVASEFEKVEEIRDSLPAPSINDLADYFEADYEIEPDDGGFIVTFSIFNADTETEYLALKAQKDQFWWDYTPDKELSVYAPEELRALCIKGREHEYEYEVERAREADALAEFNKRNEAFTREYLDLCSSLSKDRIVLAEDQKAKIEYHFSFGRYNMLSFRVGNPKFYVVKNGSEFLRAFREGSTVEYGKDLILTHSTENLREEDAAAVRFLMSARYSVSTSYDQKMKRYIYLSDASLPNLFPLLKDCAVYIDEEPVTVRLAERALRVQIDEKFILGTTLDPEKEKLYDFSGHGYVLREENGRKYLDIVALSPEETGLLSFADRQKGTCIKPILGDFKRNLYSRFFELIDVPVELARTFRLGDIRINAYFDYESGVITLATKYQKNDAELREEEIADLSDLARVRSYKEYLSSLGFAGGVLSDEAAILSFFKMDFSAMKKLCNVYLSENLTNKQLLSVKTQTIRIQYGKSGIMEAFLEPSEYTEEELREILKALRKKKKFLILSGDRIVDLDTGEAAEFAEAVSDLGLDEKALYRKKEIGMVNAIKAFAHERNCRPDHYLRSMIEEIRHYKEADVPVPALREELKNYQVEGYRWLSILSKYNIGGILADDMGLGKTLQMIALLKNDPAERPSLVVCPKSLLFNWESEFGKFDGETKVVKICGTAPQRAEIISRINACEKAVYITSYDSLRNDIGLYTVEFLYGILDEAQYIKNVKAQKTLSVKELRAQHRFAVTGTPIENSVIDLWSIFDYVMPGYFEELSAFKGAYTKDASYADAIAKKVGPFILKRSKADVLSDLPPKFERIISAEMSSSQRKLYDAMRMDAAQKIAESGQVFEILPYLTRLRQVCVDPSMFVSDYKGGSGKMDYLREMIPEYIAAGHRILLFSQFVKALESVEEILKSAGIPYYLLTGATPAKERVAMADDFNNGGEADVFLISLKAGGTGLNLTGADTVIHLDPWWNLAAENQATDRTHRIGQQRNVEVIRLIADNSIEQRVIELQQLKKGVSDRMISGDDSAVTAATLEDIAFILRQ